MAGKWDEATKKAVWNKGIVKTELPPEEWRLDPYTTILLIRYSEHGNRSSMYGWEIDHIDGPSDNLSNLRPLHWISNLQRNNPVQP